MLLAYGQLLIGALISFPIKVHAAMAPKAKHDSLDYDVTIQKQHDSTSAVAFPDDIVESKALLEWDDIERSFGANSEWFFSALLPPVAFFANFLQVEVHPGWRGKVSRLGALVANPGSNKDAPVDAVASAVRALQDERRSLYMLDEFTMPFLYQAMKSNGCRALGMYTDTMLCFRNALRQHPVRSWIPKLE